MCLDGMEARVTRRMNDQLLSIFTEEEIEGALAQMGHSNPRDRMALRLASIKNHGQL